MGEESAALDQAQSLRKIRKFRTTIFWNLPTSYILIWTWVLSIINCTQFETVQGLVVPILPYTVVGNVIISTLSI